MTLSGAFREGLNLQRQKISVNGANRRGAPRNRVSEQKFNEKMLEPRFASTVARLLAVSVMKSVSSVNRSFLRDSLHSR